MKMKTKKLMINFVVSQPYATFLIISKSAASVRYNMQK